MRRYRAYGVDLHSHLGLAGMRTAAWREDRRVEVIPAEARQVEDAFEGDAQAPDWSTQLGDGQRFELSRGAAGDLRMAYGNQAVFHLSADGARLECAAIGPGIAWQRAFADTVLSCVALRHGLDGLHAAAVVTHEGAVAIMGPSGMGKTTLVCELLARGHALLADDVVMIERRAEGLVAHPATPHMTVAREATREVAAPVIGHSLATLGPDIWLVAHRFAPDAVPLRAICILDRRPGATLGLTPQPPSHLPLLAHALSLSASARRRRFELFADVAATAPIFRLSADSAVHPGRLADLVEAAAGHRLEAAA